MWLQNKTFEFTPSGSSSETKRKTPPGLSVGGLRSAWNTLWEENVAFHLMYIVLCAAGLARIFSTIVMSPHDGFGSLLMDLVLRMAWPPVLWLVFLNSFAVPIRCAFRPPSIPNRSQLLKKDPVRRAAYPSGVHEAGEDQTFGSQTMCYTLVVIYVASLLVYSFTTS